MSNCIDDSKKIMEELSKPFDLNDIEWRVQSASQGHNGGHRVLILPYITSRSIMNRLDEVCGGLWQSHFDQIEVNKKVAFQCRLSIKIGEQWITRTDAAEVSDIESVKGGHSNALKRAGVQWGIGRYLYSLKPFWVDLMDRGEHNVYGNFTVNKQQKFLKGYFNTPALPTWATPTSGNVHGVNKQQPNSVSVSIQRQQGQNKGQKQQRQTQDEQAKIDHKRAFSLVNKLLESLQVPEEYIAPLLVKTSGVTIHYSQAKTEDLGKLYHALIPVQTYLNGCRELGVDTKTIIDFAQIVLKVKLDNVYSLFLKMTNEDCTKALDLIRDHQKHSKVV